jgi:GNAT superfamily N-acetyltransferase
MSVIRQASSVDSHNIAELHILSWRNTYSEILPENYLTNKIVGERHDYWQHNLSDSNSDGFVLLIPGESLPLAFTSVRRDQEPGYDVLLDNLHVHPEFKSQGLGREILGATLDRLLLEGARSLCLWVFDANLPTVRFYERLGGRADQHGVDDFVGCQAPHTRYGWQDLEQLREGCR